MPRQSKKIMLSKISDKTLGATSKEKLAVIGRLMLADLSIVNGGADVQAKMPTLQRNTSNARTIEDVEKAIRHFEKEGLFVSAAKLALAWKATKDMALFTRHPVQSITRDVVKDWTPMYAAALSFQQLTMTKNVRKTYYNTLWYSEKSDIRELCNKYGIVCPSDGNSSTGAALYDPIGQFILYMTYLQESEHCQLIIYYCPHEECADEDGTYSIGFKITATRRNNNIVLDFSEFDDKAKQELIHKIYDEEGYIDDTYTYEQATAQFEIELEKHKQILGKTIQEMYADMMSQQT